MGQHASKPSPGGNTTKTEWHPKSDTFPYQALKRISYVQTKTTPTTITTTTTTTTEAKEKDEDKVPSILYTPPKPSQLLNLRQRLFHNLEESQRQRQRQRHERSLAYPRFERTTAPHQRDQARKQEEWLRAFLHEFDLVFVVDDSTSMLGGQRWREVQNALAGVVMQCGTVTGEGVDMVFVNHWPGSRGGRGQDQTQKRTENGDQGQNWDDGIGAYTNLTNASQVHAIFNRIRPCGRTPFGARLAHLLLPYLDHVERAALSTNTSTHTQSTCTPDKPASNGPPQNTNQNATATARPGRVPVKPLYVVGITDGAFTDDAEEILLQAARRLQGSSGYPAYPGGPGIPGRSTRAAPWQIQVQFFRVGDDEGARRFLEALEGALRQRGREQGTTRDVLLVGNNTTSSNRLGNRLTAAGMLQRMMAGVQTAVS